MNKMPKTMTKYFRFCKEGWAAWLRSFSFCSFRTTAGRTTASSVSALFLHPVSFFLLGLMGCANSVVRTEPAVHPAAEGGGSAGSDSTDYFTRQSLIADVMADSAFGDYGHLLFPVETGYWSGRTLEELRLTYYNYIDPDMTVAIVNYLRSQALAGELVFVDIYSEEEKRANAEKRNTGLFFFRGRSGAPFAICNAGGAFAFVGAMHDSFPHALKISQQGYNAFALIYRPDYAYEDLARAIVVVHDNAACLGVHAEEYSLWGGSAGARMAATLGNKDNLRALTGRQDIPQAEAVVMQYTGYSAVSGSDAPTYACVGTSDYIAPWQTMQSRLQRLEALGIATEFHAYEGLPHGFGLGTGTVAEGWINDAIRFWEREMRK
ncbi:MAG: alpha/beta hydrolase [Paludibacteraceae bacterium]